MILICVYVGWNVGSMVTNDLGIFPWDYLCDVHNFTEMKGNISVELISENKNVMEVVQGLSESTDY